MSTGNIGKKTSPAVEELESMYDFLGELSEGEVPVEEMQDSVLPQIQAVKEADPLLEEYPMGFQIDCKGNLILEMYD
ncbi:hypothetical protein ACFLW5_01675 [Chloroflexota bacterium]